MRFVDVFPYNRDEYSQVIWFFEECIERDFQAVIDNYAHGHQYGFESCGLNLPNGEDNIMYKGPFAWAGDPSSDMCPDEYDQLDFKMFIICFELAAKVFLLNNSSYEYPMRIFDSLKLIRKNYTNVLWLIEHFYGEEFYVCDNQGVCTGEHHGKEWGEKWYETYGKLLYFDDVDQIVEAQFRQVSLKIKGIYDTIVY